MVDDVAARLPGGKSSFYLGDAPHKETLTPQALRAELPHQQPVLLRCSASCGNQSAGLCSLVVVLAGDYQTPETVLWQAVGNESEGFNEATWPPFCSAFIAPLGPMWDYSPDGIDSNLVEAVIDYVAATRNLDQDAVHLHGYSSGAMMLWHLGCGRLGERIASMAPLAGANRFNLQCNWRQHVLYAHGTRDCVVPFDYNTSLAVSAATGHSVGLGCLSRPDVSIDPESIPWLYQDASWAGTGQRAAYHAALGNGYSKELPVLPPQEAAKLDLAFSDAFNPDVDGSETEEFVYPVNPGIACGSVRLLRINNWDHSYPNRRTSARGPTYYWNKMRAFFADHPRCQPITSKACSFTGNDTACEHPRHWEALHLYDFAGSDECRLECERTRGCTEGWYSSVFKVCWLYGLPFDAPRCSRRQDWGPGAGITTFSCLEETTTTSTTSRTATTLTSTTVSSSTTTTRTTFTLTTTTTNFTHWTCFPDPDIHVDRCYAVVNKPGPWEKARQACHEEGADITVISSAEENERVHSVCTEKKRSCWIGLTEVQDNLIWKWVDGTVMNLRWDVAKNRYVSDVFQNWYAGRPTNKAWQDAKKANMTVAFMNWYDEHNWLKDTGVGTWFDGKGRYDQPWRPIPYPMCEKVMNTTTTTTTELLPDGEYSIEQQLLARTLYANSVGDSSTCQTGYGFAENGNWIINHMGNQGDYSFICTIQHSVSKQYLDAGKRACVPNGNASLQCLVPTVIQAFNETTSIWQVTSQHDGSFTVQHQASGLFLDALSNFTSVLRLAATESSRWIISQLRMPCLTFTGRSLTSLCQDTDEEAPCESSYSSKQWPNFSKPLPYPCAWEGGGCMASWQVPGLHVCADAVQPVLPS